MEHDVTLHLTPNKDGSFLVTGNPPGTGKGVGGLNRRDFADVAALRRFLSGDLGIHAPEVDKAVESMAKTRETYRLSHVMLTAEQIKAHGLGPI